MFQEGFCHNFRVDSRLCKKGKLMSDVLGHRGIEVWMDINWIGKEKCIVS